MVLQQLFMKWYTSGFWFVNRNQEDLCFLFEIPSRLLKALERQPRGSDLIKLVLSSVCVYMYLSLVMVKGRLWMFDRCLRLPEEYQHGDNEESNRDRDIYAFSGTYPEKPANGNRTY